MRRRLLLVLGSLCGLLFTIDKLSSIPSLPDAMRPIIILFFIFAMVVFILETYFEVKGIYQNIQEKLINIEAIVLFCETFAIFIPIVEFTRPWPDNIMVFDIAFNMIWVFFLFFFYLRGATDDKTYDKPFTLKEIIPSAISFMAIYLSTAYFRKGLFSILMYIKFEGAIYFVISVVFAILAYFSFMAIKLNKIKEAKTLYIFLLATAILTLVFETGILQSFNAIRILWMLLPLPLIIGCILHFTLKTNKDKELSKDEELEKAKEDLVLPENFGKKGKKSIKSDKYSIIDSDYDAYCPSVSCPKDLTRDNKNDKIIKDIIKLKDDLQKHKITKKEYDSKLKKLTDQIEEE